MISPRAGGQAVGRDGVQLTMPFLCSLPSDDRGIKDAQAEEALNVSCVCRLWIPGSHAPCSALPPVPTAYKQRLGPTSGSGCSRLLARAAVRRQPGTMPGLLPPVQKVQADRQAGRQAQGPIRGMHFGAGEHMTCGQGTCKALQPPSNNWLAGYFLCSCACGCPAATLLQQPQASRQAHDTAAG